MRRNRTVRVARGRGTREVGMESRSHARAWAGIVFGVLVSVGVPVRADGPGARLTAVADADPIELARVAGALGDSAVLAAMSEGRPGAERLAAVRAAPWLDAPELALDLLVRLLVGRDSELAPSAARAVARIAAALDADTLARREVLPESLSAVRAKLTEAVERETLRADIRVLAAEAAFQLSAAGVP